jgi:hypothetical protein
MVAILGLAACARVEHAAAATPTAAAMKKWRRSLGTSTLFVLTARR